MTVDYSVTFTGAELDLLYELARDARNNLPDPDDIPEIGSWANQVALMDNKLTSLYHERRR